MNVSKRRVPRGGEGDGMVVYLDLLILDNFCADAALLYLAVRTVKGRVRYLRIALVALAAPKWRNRETKPVFQAHRLSTRGRVQPTRPRVHLPDLLFGY